MKRLLRWIDRLNEWVGKTTCVLIVILTLLVGYQVFRRYVLNRPTIWEFESCTYLFGIFFMLGAGYTHLKKGHVSIDILEQRLSPRKRALLALAGTLFLVVPFLAVMTWQAVDFASRSWATLERSASTWGPPLYPVKTFMPVGFGLLTLQAVSWLVRDVLVVMGKGDDGAES